MNQYFAVIGSGLTDKDAQIIGPEIERLEEAGLSTPKGVREAARPEDSPLHEYVFDCETDEAAEKHYLNRAGHILRSIQVEVTYSRGGQPVTHRMRSHRPVWIEHPGDEEPPRERRYVSIMRIRQDVELSVQVWQDGLRQLQLWRSRFKELDDVFGPVFRAIEETEKRLGEDAA